MATDYLSDMARAYLSRTPTVQPVATRVRLASEVQSADEASEREPAVTEQPANPVQPAEPARPVQPTDTTEPWPESQPSNDANSSQEAETASPTSPSPTQPAATPEQVAARARALEFEHKTALARTIKSRMAELGMNQNQLSAATGIGVGQVSLILNAKQNITLRTLARIEAVLGVRFDAGFVFGR